MNRVERHERLAAVAAAIDNPAVVDDRALVNRRPRAKTRASSRARRAPAPSTAGSSALITAQSPASWFSKIRALAAPYAATSRMPIEMVRREVQHHRDPRVERVDLLELKAARLDDMQRVGGRHRHLRAQRRADVAADRHLESRRLEHPPGQRGRRRLAFRAGDRDHAALQPPRRELDLGDHRDAAIARRLQRRPDPAARPG